MARLVSLHVAPPPPVELALSMVGGGKGAHAQLLLYGTAGQRQVLETSSNLANWTPLAKNASGTNLFQLSENGALQFAKRFYRAVVTL